MNETNQNITSKSPIIDEPQIEFSQVRIFFSNILSDIWDLKKGVDKKGTIEEISNKKSLAGANAWMLMCSIIIASIGLDRNSPAVIIGAMLISPLMSPILGIGLGVGINDRRVLKSSLLHFSVAIVIALIVSTLYFVITPLGIYGSEIEARTEPTMLDILIAFFGGVAGIISYARKDISTTIPGVAIATALMPPLCVTGYGIANWDTPIILNSFYLFLSNSFFICLATYVIVRFLKFPFRKYPNKKEKRRNMIYVSIFSLLVVIPSLFILNNVIKKIDTDHTIEKMLVEQFGEDMQFLDDYKLIAGDTSDVLMLKVYGNGNSAELEEKSKRKLESLGINDLEVRVIYTSEVNLDQFDNLRKQLKDASKNAQFSDSLKTLQNQNNSLILDFQEELKRNLMDTTEFNAVAMAAKAKFPQLERIAIGNLAEKNFTKKTNSRLPTAIIAWKKDTDVQEKDNLENSLKVFLEGFLRRDKILLFSE